MTNFISLNFYTLDKYCHYVMRITHIRLFFLGVVMSFFMLKSIAEIFWVYEGAISAIVSASQSHSLLSL